MMRIDKKGTPTVFVVNSPLQVLCAFEAIDYFCIKTFLFVFPIIESPRNKSLFQMMEERKLPFVVERQEHFYFPAWIKSITKRKYFTYSSYHRAFVGDEESIVMRFCAYKYLAPCSTIGYLDDGNRTLNLLKGIRFVNESPQQLNKEKWFRRLTMTKDTKTYFTIYNDVENTKYRLIPNKFISLVSKRNTTNKDRKGVYFIGTNIEIYCQKIGLNIEQYWHYLSMAFSEVKKRYPNERIIYIPHGRDCNPVTERICKENGLEFERLDTAIECYMINLHSTPIAFFSYTSTALFTLKKMFPESENYNIFCDGMKVTPLYQTYIDFSNYFSKHGITLLLQSDINMENNMPFTNLLES